MADAPEPDLDDLLWTVAVARLVLGPAMNIQAPPNLLARRLSAADRGRHQRLGRRLAGHARPRQSGSAVAGDRRARARDRGGRQGAGRAAADLSGVCARRADAGSTPAVRTRGARASSDAEGLRARRRLGAGRGPIAPRRRRRCAARGAIPALLERDRRARQRRRAARRAGDRRAVRGARRRLSRVCAAADALRAQRQRRRRSATSSTATSTTPTSATTAARSAPSPRARRTRRCAARPTTRPGRDRAPRARSLGARRDRSVPAGRHPSATTPATTYLAICRAVKARGARHAHPRLLAAGGHAGRGDARAVASRASWRG